MPRFQFVNDDRRRRGADGNEPRAALPIAGRLIMRLGKDDRKSLRMEYSLRWWGSWGFDLGHDEDVSVVFLFPPLFLSFGASGFVRSARYNEGRELALKFHDGSVWWNLWKNPDSWSREDRWRKGSWNLADTFLGRQVYTTRELDTRSVLVPMPEGTYVGKALLFESCWKRPRWFASYVTRVTIDLEKAIPCQGKGENAWDCGVSGTRGITCMARSIGEGVGVLVGSVLNDRVKYGGWSDWKWDKPVEKA